MMKKILQNHLPIVSGIYWITFLINTDSYYIVYLLIGIMGGICLYANNKDSIAIDKKYLITGKILSAVISSAITLANYNVFATYFDLSGKVFELCYSMGSALLVLVGGYYLVKNILIYIVSVYADFYWEKVLHTVVPWKIFVISFFSISILYLIIFYLFNYPGTFTPDSAHQLREIISGDYSNHHPFYSTLLIKMIFSIGGLFSSDINTLVAAYSMFQIVFISLCFAFVIVTVYQMRLPKKMIVGIGLFYIFMPYNIAFSTTMRKDVLFSLCIMVFIVSFFRIINDIGEIQKLNDIILFLSGMGICLFRNNGWMNYIFTTAMFFLIFTRKEKNNRVVRYKQIGKNLILTGLLSYILLNPILTYLDIEDSDILEKMAIPIQQIARIIRDCNDLTEEQTELLSNIVDIERVGETYLPYFVDPLKNLIREKQNVIYITEEKDDFIKLYLDLGISHPEKYVAAWIDQTRGYWNGGYSYWRWEHGVQENTLGIYRTEGSYLFSRLMYEYLWIFQVVPVLYLFLCIGLFVWIVVCIAYIGYTRNNKSIVFMSVPILGNVATLLIATPVFAEFRYSYSVFLCVPILFLILFYDNKGKEKV